MNKPLTLNISPILNHEHSKNNKKVWRPLNVIIKSVLAKHFEFYNYVINKPFSYVPLHIPFLHAKKSGHVVPLEHR